MLPPSRLHLLAFFLQEPSLSACRLKRCLRPIILIGVPNHAIKVLTRDSVTVSVDAVVYYRVSNATVSVANVENAHHSTRLLAQTTLRNILGTKNLHEILSDRESISTSMQVSSPPDQHLNQAMFSPERSGRGHNGVGHQSGASRNVRQKCS